MDPSYQGDTRDAMLPAPTGRNALEGCPAMIMLLADSHRQGRLSKQPGRNKDAESLRTLRSFSLCYHWIYNRREKTDGTYADFSHTRAGVSRLTTRGRADGPTA